MNIKSILVRLQSAMGRNDLVEQMVLLPGSTSLPSEAAKSTKSINLVVGYDRSPSSQTALDVSLWIAHQTRLATQNHVTLHVVYVVDENQTTRRPVVFNAVKASKLSIQRNQMEYEEASPLRSGTPVLTRPRQKALAAHPRTTLIDPCYFRAMFYQNDAYENADRILSQARSLADEWGGSFKFHLRFGSVADELKNVVELEKASVLLLGCNSDNHPIVQQLGSNFPCPVLGIPSLLNSPVDANQEQMG